MYYSSHFAIQHVITESHLNLYILHVLIQYLWLQIADIKTFYESHC